MKLIDLYLDDIRHRLPPRNREDILNEIRSALMDMIEDRNPDPEQAPEDALIESVLMEFGPPRKVARQYGSQSYLIGPRIYPSYLMVLKIVLIIVAALNVLGLIVSVAGKTGFDAGAFDAILQIIGGLFSSLFSAFGIVTLVFAGIERTASEQWTVELDQEWHPDDLRQAEDKEHVNLAGLAIEITLSLIFIALINFFLNRIGIYYFDDTGWISEPILNDNFRPYIPWITAYVTFDIALNLYLIRKGFWDKLATILKVMINAFKIAVTIAIISGPSIITVTESAWQRLNFDLSITAEQLSRGLNTGLNVLLGLAIFGMVVESIQYLYKGFIKGRHASIEIKS